MVALVLWSFLCLICIYMASEKNDRSMFTLVGFIHLEQLKENEGGSSCEIVK